MPFNYFKFENKSQQVISPVRYFSRQMRYAVYAFLIISFSLLLGMMGYHYFGIMSWLDALLNASMILTGMGPVNPMTSDAAKLFASFYALYSGVAFLTTIGVLLAPALHRMMHIIHLEK